MPKTAVFTTITPLPAGVTRKSVLDMYQDHLAMIDLNPLVVERFKCKTPSYATTDEYYATWYTIKDKVSYLPGGLAQGSVSYHACFHDQSDGLQTHVYAPLGLDIQGKWTVGGTLPGEPKENTEPGLNAPRSGLYIREDVKMRCSTLLMSFVKKTFKDSHARLVEKLVDRAHVIESNFANERLQALRNVDPGERMGHGDIFIAPPPDYNPPDYNPPAYSLSLFPPLRTLPHTNLGHSRSLSEPVRPPRIVPKRSPTVQSPLSRNEVKPEDPQALKFSFAYVSGPIASSAPEQSTYILPATTYDGGLSQFSDRPISMYPGGPHLEHSERMISIHVTSILPDHDSDTPTQELISPLTPDREFILSSTSGPLSPGIEPLSPTTNPLTPIINVVSPTIETAILPPRLSYHPAATPLAWDFPFEANSPSPFDTTSTSNRPSDPLTLLSEIDDAIDQVFMYTLPASKYEPVVANVFEPLPSKVFEPLPSKPLETLSNKVFEPLPSKAYEGDGRRPSTSRGLAHARGRKDSAMPERAEEEDMRPPMVPIKDDKWRRAPGGMI